MPQYARFEITRQDAAGNPIVGATITLRKQGSTVVSGGPTAYTVDDPGGLVTGDTVNRYLSDGSDPVSGSVSVTVNSATSLTLGGGGFSASNNDRISSSSDLPSVFKDAQGNEAAGTLTTDSNGYAACWVEFQPLDVVSTGGTSALGAAVTKVWFDVYPSGIGRRRFNDYNGTATAQRWQSRRAFATTDKYLSILNSNGDEEFYFAGGGGQFKLGVAGSTASCTINGNVNMVGAFAVSVGALSCSAGFTHSGGAFSVVAGSIATAHLAANAIHPAPVRIDGTSTDVGVITSEVARLTTSYTPTSGNVGVRVVVNLPYAMVSEGTGQIEVRLYIGGALKTKGVFGHWTVAATDMNSSGTVSFEWIEPTMAASPTTIEVRDIKVTRGGGTTATYQYDGASSYAGYMFISEMKK